jgi:hypothetical protein
MTPLTDSLGQPIDAGDLVVYASGSRTSPKRLALVLETKKKVKVHFFRGDTLSPWDGSDTDVEGRYAWDVEWLAAPSLVVVTGFKTFKPKARKA